MKLALHFCVLSSILFCSKGRPTFVALIPNGDGVTGFAALGHINAAGGGTTNSFGEAFSNAGYEWTKELCQVDSDGDGATNGQELGDPCCTWTPSSGSSVSSSPTHPGVRNTFSSEQLAAMSCSGEADQKIVTDSKKSVSTSSSASAIGDGNSIGSSFDDVVALELQPRFSPQPKLDQRSLTPATSEAENPKTFVVALYSFSIFTLVFVL